ncbi:MAG: hypothetical protein EOP08_04995 [Proteobacteria bacterium]|nr:MAG: hypothetical protein EOP08_04995 [Pseudomonadota bacterium]
MVERRTRRSEDPLVALHYKLAKTRQDRGLEAIVVADADGLVIAGAGAWPLCEEVAAYAPMLGESDRNELPARLAGRVSVRRADDLWVCLVGETTSEDPELDASSHAVTRILAA